MDTKFVAGVIWFNTWRKLPVTSPSGEPCLSMGKKSDWPIRTAHSHTILSVLTEP